jgi:hypothetical protein
MDGTGEHPCFGEPVEDLRDGSYFYSFDPASYPASVGDCRPTNANELPVCWNSLGASNTEQVTLHAVLCMLEVDRDADPIVRGCTTDPNLQDPRYFLVTLLARGEADCNDAGNDCKAETLIAEKIGSFGPGADAGSPNAPLTARTNVPLNGTVEIVPNPNGGGVGVPLSSRVNTNPNCPDTPADPITPVSGSYATCERHEYYQQDTLPEDFRCPSAQCSCSPSEDKMITYATGNDRVLGIDILPDDDFPCDLFHDTFRLTPEQIKGLAAAQPGHLLENCESLDENSKGFYWISGPSCTLRGQIGGPSKEEAVFLVSAATTTTVNSTAELFGVLMVTTVEDPDAEFTGNGGATIYGAAIMDADMKNFNGTFQIVYVDTLVDGAFETPLFGAVAGGWTDFHSAWR